MPAISSIPLLPAPARAASTGRADTAARYRGDVDGKDPAATSTKDANGANGAKSATGTELTPEQQAQLAKLKQTDQKVRTHEAAHLAAGNGVVTSGARYEYTTGPDGKRYAVGGEVSIDTGREDEPKANIEKGQRIQRAALAPAEPSSQDYRVAAVGAQMVADGYRDLRIETREGPNGPSALGQRMAQTYGTVAAQGMPGSSGGMGISLFA